MRGAGAFITTLMAISVTNVGVLAAPTPHIRRAWPSLRRSLGGLERRDDVTQLSNETVKAFDPYTWYASTAYCAPQDTLAWSCGGACACCAAVVRVRAETRFDTANCNANKGFKPIAAGGNGVTTQYCKCNVGAIL
jgi:hypothetical protein